MKKWIFLLVLGAISVGAYFGAPAAKEYLKENKTQIAVKSVDIFRDVAKLLPIEENKKSQIDAIASISDYVLQKDGKTRRYLLLLQNNMELRPGGGFLGQYAIVRVRDGEVIDFKVEDANLLDQRIKVKVTPPWPFTRYLQIKRWKFRDSNFSPDFPTNVAKARYFLRLAGVNNRFDGVVAINATVLNEALKITGPITVRGVTFDAKDAVLTLEEAVGKNYLGDDVDPAAKQARKNIMIEMAHVLLDRLVKPSNFKKISDLAFAELNNKDVQLFFTDENLQAKVVAAGWSGKLDDSWDNDFLMVVDANLGGLKSDYFVKRRIVHEVDFTTGERAVATTRVYYNHTAKYGDWRTSDWHGYVRMIVPSGSEFLERVKTGGVRTTHLKDFNKTQFGYKVDAVMNRELETIIKYRLPAHITADNYKFYIQKQSGVGDVPLTVIVKTPKKGAVAGEDGAFKPEDVNELKYETILKRDIKIKMDQIKEKLGTRQEEIKM